MSNKKQVSSKIRAKPPVDTNKPKYAKRTLSIVYNFGEFGCPVEVNHEDEVRFREGAFSVDDIPVVIEILQDIYKNRGLL